MPPGNIVPARVDGIEVNGFFRRIDRVETAALVPVRKLADDHPAPYMVVALCAQPFHGFLVRRQRRRRGYAAPPEMIHQIDKQPFGNGVFAQVFEQAQVGEHNAPRTIPLHQQIAAPPGRLAHHIVARRDGRSVECAAYVLVPQFQKCFCRNYIRIGLLHQSP